MLIALIFLVNLLVIGIAFFLRWRGWRTAHIWMILVFISLVGWLLFILVKLENFSPLVLPNWMAIGDMPVLLQFQISANNWPFAFSFLTAIPIFLLTGIARLDVRNDLKFWSAGILFISIAFLASLAADLWSVVIFWTALDLLEVFYQLVIFKEPDYSQLQRSLIVRFFGGLLLIFVTATLSTASINPVLVGLSESGSVMVFIAALLHSGVFPFKQTPSTVQSPQTEWILRGLVKLIVLMASFSLLVYFPKPNLSFIINTALQIVTYLFIFRVGLIEITSKEKEADSQWTFFLAGFIVFLYLNSANLEFWLPALFLTSVFLLVYSHRSRSTMLFPLIMTLLVSSAPYTVNSIGSRAFLFDEFRISILGVIPPLVLFLGHFFKTTIQYHKDFSEIESIYQVVYLFGLLLLILASGVISFKFIEPLQREVAHWWVGVIVVSLLAGLYILQRKRKIKLPNTSKLYFSVSAQKFLSLDWIFRLSAQIEKRLKNLAAGFSNLFEGAGGLLWALVLLVLILTVLR